MQKVNYSYGKAILAGFEYLLENHPEVFVIGQGLWSPWYVGNSMTDLDKKFGKERIIDTPVSENACTGAGVGASLAGMKPIIVHPRMDFMLYAMDPIINQAAKWSYMFGGQANPQLTIRAIINRARKENSLLNLLEKINVSNPILKSRPNWAFPAHPAMVVAWAFMRSIHHKSVLDYFLSDPNLSKNLICVDIKKSGWLGFTSERLKLPLPDSKIHANLTKESRAIKKYKLLVEEIIEKGLSSLSHTDPEMLSNLLSNSIGLENKKFNDLKKNANFYI